MNWCVLTLQSQKQKQEDESTSGSGPVAARLRFMAEVSRVFGCRPAKAATTSLMHLDLVCVGGRHETASRIFAQHQHKSGVVSDSVKRQLVAQ